MTDFLDRPLKLFNANPSILDGAQLRLGYDEDNYLDFIVDSEGDVTVVGTGGTLSLPSIVLAAEAFIGDGDGLTNLAADALASGTVPLARITGLTNDQIAAAADIEVTKLATGSAGQVLRVNESDEPEWGAVDPLSIAPGSDGQILQTNASGEVVFDSVEHSRLTDRDAAASHPVTAINDVPTGLALDALLRRVVSASRVTSELMFHFDAFRGAQNLSASPVTVDGLAGSFTRASTRFAINEAGEIYEAAAGEMARHYAFDSTGRVIGRGVILGRAQTNRIAHPDDLTQGGTGNWTIQGVGVDRTFGAGPYAGRTFTTIASTTTGTTNRVIRNIGFTGDGEKTIGVLFRLRDDTPAVGSSEFSILGIYDQTAGAVRMNMRIQRATAGTAEVSVTNGVLLRLMRLKDQVYFAAIRTTAVVAANANQLRVIASNASLNGGASGLGSIDVAGVTALDSTVMQMPYTQAAPDYLRFPIRFFPQVCTILTDYLSMGLEETVSSTRRLWQIGQAGNFNANARAFVINRNTSGLRGYLYDAAGANAISNDSGAVIAYGDRVLSRYRAITGGAPRMGVSINGGAEANGTEPTGVGFAATWAGFPADAELAIGADTSGANQGGILLRSLKIASGDVSLATLAGMN